jgi:SpoIID/LytB domain protein
VIVALLLAASSLHGWDAVSEAAALERSASPGPGPDTAASRTDSAPGQLPSAAPSVATSVVRGDNPAASTVQTSSRTVRIVLREGASSVNLGWTGTFRADSRTVPGSSLNLVKSDLAEAGLPLAPDGSLLLEPVDSGSHFALGKRRYRGAVRIVRFGSGLAVVNELAMEDYLLGVVPGEIGRKLDPKLLEAVKAQAVVARTYAARGLGQYGGKPWDLRDDVRDQVYEGLAGEDPLCTKAVLETRGRILVDASGRPVDAYYHSTSGGATADIRDVWPGKSARSYLLGIDDTAPDGSAWGSYSPSAAWTETWSEKSLHAAVARDLPSALAKPCDPGEVKSLRLSGHDNSGRARKLLVEGRKATCEVISDRIRWALRRPDGKSILRSARFSLQRRDGSYVAKGTGNGHGVGLSQTGALARARAGQRFETILTSYYPGTSLSIAGSVPWSLRP